jgi:nucleotide-binding universal stress UspA family protein
LNGEWTPRRVGVGFVDLEEGYEALRAGVALAGAAGASLHAVTALEPLDLSRSATIAPDRVGVGLDAAQAAARRTLRVAVEQLAGGVPASTKVVVGHAPDSLIALSTEVDLLVCGSRAYGPTDLLGSVTRRLTRFANCPVIIVPRGAERSIQRLLDHREPVSSVTRNAR